MESGNLKFGGVKALYNSIGHLKKWLPHIIVGLLLSVVSVFVVSSVLTGVVTAVMVGGVTRPLTSNLDFSQWVELKLPLRSVLVQGEIRGGAAAYALAEIQMPPQAVAQFLAQPNFGVGIAPSSSKVDRDKVKQLFSVSPGSKDKGWGRLTMKRSLAIDGDTVMIDGRSESVWILINLDNPRFAVVYLYIGG